MIKNYARILRIFYIFGDITLLNVAFLLSYWVRFGEVIPNYHYLLLLLYSNVIWLFISFLLDNYEVSRVDGYTRVTKMMLQSVLLHFLSITAVFVFIKASYFSRYFLAYHYIIFFLLAVLWRRGMVYGLRFFRKRGFNFKQFIVLGYGELGEKLVSYFSKHPEFGYRFKGYFDDKKQGNAWQGTFNEVENYVVQEGIHEIYCSTQTLSQEYLKKLRRFADQNIIRLKILPDLQFLESANIHMEDYGGIPVVLTRSEPLENIANQVVKRIFDVVFSLAVILLIFSWLFPIIFLLIKLDSRGPVFFIQKRSGKDGRAFACFKFRTMYHQKDAKFMQATKKDSRITRIGAFLRKTNLDEVPQFLNVFLGDMTVVGPRPHPIALDDTFRNIIEKYMVRHLVKPGVTGLAQVKGLRGETNKPYSMLHRIKMDIFYIENWSFLLDIKIIFLTVWNMVRGDKNAY